MIPENINFDSRHIRALAWTTAIGIFLLGFVLGFIPYLWLALTKEGMVIR